MTDLDQLRATLSHRDDPALPLAEAAYRYLLREIIDMSLKPGEVLNEADLQQRLGAGRTPIREALLRLAGDRLVTIHARRGTFVSDLNVTDLGAVYEVRTELERLAASLAAERRNDAEAVELASIRGQLPAFVRGSDADGLMTIDLYLHRLVFRLARNEFLADTLEHYLNLSTRLARAAVERTGASSSVWLADALLGFIPLFEAIEGRRPEAAVAAAMEHAAAVEAHVRRSV